MGSLGPGAMAGVACPCVRCVFAQAVFSAMYAGVLGQGGRRTSPRLLTTEIGENFVIIWPTFLSCISWLDSALDQQATSHSCKYYFCIILVQACMNVSMYYHIHRYHICASVGRSEIQGRYSRC